MKGNLTRHGRLVGGYVPIALFNGVITWVQKDHERDVSTFLRQAFREKLAREGIAVQDHKNTEAV
jgi:hypothetical protein